MVSYSLYVGEFYYGSCRYLNVHSVSNCEDQPKKLKVCLTPLRGHTVQFFFGPYDYDGHRYGANPLQKTSIYSWQIPDQTGQIKYYVDAIDPNKSNWLRYINCPNTLRQQNLISFIYNNDIFYLAIMTQIQINTLSYLFIKHFHCFSMNFPQ
ncbi:unnamed protein product, partial [Adineta ricciae]